MKSKKSVLLVLIAATFWGTAGIFVRSLTAFGIEAMQTVFGRAVFSALIFAVIILLKDPSLFKIKLRDIWAFFCLGFFSIVMFNYCYYKTMSLSSLSTAAVLLYTAPFFVIIISAVLFKDKITFKKAFACITAFIGCCFVSGAFSQRQTISAECIFFGLMTGFGYGLYTIFSNILFKRKYQTLTINFYAFLFALIMSLPFSKPVETIKNLSDRPISILIVFLMAVINTVIPYICYTAALKKLDGPIALIIATLEPVVATLIGFLVFKEALTVHSAIGIILVLGSVVILHKGERNAT
ncbi:MAG: EamA family transporter [Ruminococcaceae bacterium]|nr:EamA family transporter [Oscillospiraceae bacterium]